MRLRANVLQIDAQAFADYDIHIHFPAAGVPKDRPSAGITVGLVIASVLSERPIRDEVAMTGEASLRDKALAAHRDGLRAMLYPAVNENDLGGRPRDGRDRLELVPVGTMDDVFAVALHRVIVPRRVGDRYIVDVSEDDVLPREEGAPVTAAAEEAAPEPVRRVTRMGSDGNGS